MALSDSYKEPQYNLIKKDGKIEIREYSEYVIAKTSPTSKRGIKTPVDVLAPYVKAKPVTISAAIPFIPDFETPSKKAQKAARLKSKRFNSNKKLKFYGRR